MGLETRGSGIFFYEKVREGKKVSSRYGGAGALALEAAEFSTLARGEQMKAWREEKRYRTAIQNEGRETLGEYRNTMAVVQDILRLLGFHKHRGQWRRKRMKKNNQAVEQSSPALQFVEIYKKVTGSADPNQLDVEEMKRLALAVPASWPILSRSSEDVRKQLTERMCPGTGSYLLSLETEIVKKQLNYDESPFIEKMIIEHLLTAKIRLLFAEHEYTRKIHSDGFAQASGRFWMEVLDSAQKRFLRATETLARVRRLSRITPAVQINVAQAGGQQVNLASVNANTL